ncbi:uncharacterized protein LOC117815687 isoform X2 [Notolabrus celidotus]|uniref:uncharacterized protein LOC117815687 isoform X2 n=1 Tax=Notolabrus celidotus TaxID=1203425 RepID=UPI00148FC347|nr:uncharacterized protein LOC117815687 isoform X2 [Notolabrus celidotus]
MVQRRLCTLEHLMNSKFGLPFPRHGLQLLFWFAKDCVTCELIKCVLIMKLVSDCHPERGCFGFHLFGNMEELLPVLDQPGKKRKKRVLYYEVGNLNTETYPGSEDLPAYVTQNYGFEGDYNTDRLIISYQARSRVVKTVYVTQHERDFSGCFCPDETYEISSELIQALQSPLVDLTSFLTQMGFYKEIPVVRWCEEEIYDDEEEIYDYEEQMFDSFYNYTDSTVRTEQSDPFGYFSASFSDPYTVHSNVSITTHNNRPVANYSGVRQRYITSGWERPYRGRGFDKEDEGSSRGGGFSFLRLLLGAGALLLAVKCFSWMRSCWQVEETFPKRIQSIPRIPLSYWHTHPMLDYTY